MIQCLCVFEELNTHNWLRTFFSLVTDRTKKVSLQFTAEDPNKSARDDDQLQTQLAQQVRELLESDRKWNLRV